MMRVLVLSSIALLAGCHSQTTAVGTVVGTFAPSPEPDAGVSAEYETTVPVGKGEVKIAWSARGEEGGKIIHNVSASVTRADVGAQLIATDLRVEPVLPSCLGGPRKSIVTLTLFRGNGDCAPKHDGVVCSGSVMPWEKQIAETEQVALTGEGQWTVYFPDGTEKDGRVASR